MVNLTAALGRNGFQDWVLQRVTAIILGAYTIFLCLFWLLNFEASAWSTLFKVSAMRYATLLALIAVMVHAWIGLWIICTDYLKISAIRLSAFIAIYCCLLFDFIWAIQILWGY